MNILFVCLGNICRSPAAEGVARVMLANNSRIIRIDSAGIGNWHEGQAPNLTMQKVAAAAGFPIGDLRARQVTASDFLEFDYIFGMDRQNIADLQALQAVHGGKAQVLLLLDKAGAATDEVPDPYYGGFDGFVESFELIRMGVESMVRSYI